MRHTNSGKKQPQIIVDLRYCTNRRSGVVGDAFLVDRYCRRKAFYVINVRLVHTSQKLAGIGGQRLYVAALALCVNRVKGQRTLSGTGYSGNHHQLVTWYRDFYILEVMLAGAFYVDEILRHTTTPLTQKYRPTLYHRYDKLSPSTI